MLLTTMLLTTMLVNTMPLYKNYDVGQHHAPVQGNYCFPRNNLFYRISCTHRNNDVGQHDARQEDVRDHEEGNPNDIGLACNITITLITTHNTHNTNPTQHKIAHNTMSHKKLANSLRMCSLGK